MVFSKKTLILSIVICIITSSAWGTYSLFSNSGYSMLYNSYDSCKETIKLSSVDSQETLKTIYHDLPHFSGQLVKIVMPVFRTQKDSSNQALNESLCGYNEPQRIQRFFLSPHPVF